MALDACAELESDLLCIVFQACTSGTDREYSASGARSLRAIKIVRITRIIRILKLATLVT